MRRHRRRVGATNSFAGLGNGASPDRIREYSSYSPGIRATHLKDQIDDLFLDHLYHASALHDIGKIAVPDCILLHPGKLTDAQRDQIQQHTLMASRFSFGWLCVSRPRGSSKWRLR